MSTTRGTILIFMFSEQSGFNASFRLLRNLRERGYRVIYLGTPTYQGYVTDQGFEYKALDLYGEEKLGEAAAAPSALGRFQDRLAKMRVMGEAYYRSLPQIEEWLRRVRPVLVLLDPLVWWFAPPFLKAGVPMLALNNTLASVRRPAVPPVFSGLTPERNAHRHSLWSLRCRLAWLQRHLAVRIEKARFHFWLGASLGLGQLRRSPYSLVRDLNGRLCRDEYGYRLDLPELVLCPYEFELPCVPRTSGRCHAGAAVEPQRVDPASEWAPSGDGRLLVYGSLGTYSGAYPWSRRLFLAAVEAFRRRPEWDLVLQVGMGAVRKELPSLPKNVFVFEKVPQMQVLSHASIFITHGGISSIREAIYFGTPMIVFPCWLDQPGNAARVVFHRLGARGKIEDVDARALTELMDRVVQDETVRAAVQRMQRIFRAQESCERGAQLIERFLSERGRKETAPPPGGEGDGAAGDPQIRQES